MGTQKFLSYAARIRASRAIRREIEASRRILIATHIDPDPDAIGSQLGLYHILKTRFPRKRFYLFDETRGTSKQFAVMDGANLIKDKLPNRGVDLVIGLDAGSFDRLGIGDYVKRFKPRIVYIDHHEPGGYAGDVIWVEKGASSTSELVYELAELLHWRLSRSAAGALLIGIEGDTLHFRLATPRVFEIAANLMRLKPDFERQSRNIFGWSSLNMMHVIGAVFQSAKFVPSKKFIYAFLTAHRLKKFGVKAGELAFIADRLRDFRGAEVSAFIREKEDGAWDGSLRSVEAHPSNLADIARRFGGGGHAHASGFSTNLRPEAVLRRIIAALPDRR